MNPSSQAAPFMVAALYRFMPVTAPADLRARLVSNCREAGVKGTLLVAPEGINGTVAAAPGAIRKLLDFLETLPGFAGAEVKFSWANEAPFRRMKVRVKKEIVTMGVAGIDPSRQTGRYVEPRDWNALISDPETVVIDTRNAYEVALGTFAGAVDPGTASFGDFPEWARAHREKLAGRKVAMFCTGGIRCEKATSFMRALGLEDVYHLKGGILKYLEDVPFDKSLWRGECFVFDERVSVKEGLQRGDAELCRACRHPLLGEDRASPFYVEGVSCPHCHDARSDADRARYAERHRQVGLAQRLGKGPHIGG